MTCVRSEFGTDLLQLLCAPRNLISIFGIFNGFLIHYHLGTEQQCTFEYSPWPCKEEECVLQMWKWSFQGVFVGYSTMLWTDQDEVDPSGSDPEKADQFLCCFVLFLILFYISMLALYCIAVIRAVGIMTPFSYRAKILHVSPPLFLAEEQS